MTLMRIKIKAPKHRLNREMQMRGQIFRERRDWKDNQRHINPRDRLSITILPKEIVVQINTLATQL